MNQQCGDPKSLHSYTVAWICALQEELRCACYMLDEEFKDPDLLPYGDDNRYVFGRVDKHYVAVVRLADDRYGNFSATYTATNMVLTFPNLQFALMVGIGGGVPSTKNDIRLGDVVVSQPRGSFGGVVEYDRGLNGPAKVLLDALEEIRKRYNDHRKPDTIAQHIRRMDIMKDYRRPRSDQLFQASYVHTGGKTCEHCDLTKVIRRPHRQAHRAVTVHYGTIASGNSVMKDAVTRERYAQNPELNVLCFEMEAAGLMNIVPCLVVRGISDYSDSHKNDEWRKYAALSAAAYAREEIMEIAR
ncbi:5'-methylthioadenosine/S-adenosylhomocysteine nucleosidase family protein [Aspergillus lucknowensis]|uniref:Purine and uridine phosphorylase n=1 Tax=Aspergillus lucknowensis TaxID=176173 RepID=A0ABR4LUV8_9EURO